MTTPTMFCFQCQETAGCRGCTVQGVCGKTPAMAALQDLLLYATRGLAQVATRLRAEGGTIDQRISSLVSSSLFSTITNVNFDVPALERQIRETLTRRDELAARLQKTDGLSDAALFTVNDRASMLEKASRVGVLATENEDIRSLRELITYGLKGLCAYLRHADVLGFHDDACDRFVQSTLAGLLDDSLSVDDLTSLVLETGRYGVAAMALLDTANTRTYGNPGITEVRLGVRSRPGILVSGHDLRDLEMLLEQAEGQDVDVYTHCEMLAAHYYPAFRKYTCLAGNYGSAWWKQHYEFERFNGPVLMTTNCVIPPRDSYRGRLFTTGAVSVEGCRHIDADADGKKDFSEIIALARTCPAPEELEQGTFTGGFAHEQLMALADRVVEAVRSGAIRKFVVMAGCDGRQKSRAYYREFAEKLPGDTVILTAGCAKYRYMSLPLGSIGGIPRVLDAGQCNDSYSLALIALKLKEVFGLDDINELPLVFNISWYEQKAVIVLLALLHLGVKNIHLGPTLPAFLSPDVADVLVRKFGIGGITDVENDMKLLGIS